MAETEHGRDQLKRFEARRRIKLEPGVDPKRESQESGLRGQDETDHGPLERVSRAAGQSYPSPTTEGEEDLASPVHPVAVSTPRVEEGVDGDQRVGGDQMSEFDIDSDPEDDMEIGLVQGWIGEILELEQDQVEDIMEELDELCSLSVTLGDERGAFYRRAREHVRASVAEVYSPPRVTLSLIHI